MRAQQGPLARKKHTKEGDGSKGQNQDGGGGGILGPFGQRMVVGRAQVHTSLKGAVEELSGEDQANQKQEEGGFPNLQVEGGTQHRQAQRNAYMNAHVALGGQSLVPSLEGIAEGGEKP